MKIIRGTFQALFLLALLLSLQGCSFKFVYQQVHWALPWYAGRVFDLSSEQEEELKRSLSGQLRWHQKTQLPLYIEALGEWEVFALRSHSAAEFDRLLVQNQVHLTLLVKHLVSDVSPFLLSLSVSQRKTLFELIDESNQRYRSRYLLDEESVERVRAESFIESVHFWFGSVGAVQKQEVLKSLADYASTESIVYSNRQQSLARLQVILTGQMDESLRREQLDEFLNPPWYHVTALDQKKLDHNMVLSVSLTEKLLYLATQKQRKHAAAFARGWANELSELL